MGWEAFPKEICEANLPKPTKIKSFLIEKFLSLALLKIKIFVGFGGWRQPPFRKRWAGLLPYGRQLKACPVGNLFSFGVSVRILVKIGSDFFKYTLPVGKRGCWLALY
ncbi:MAG: hypothetical protein ACP5IX_03475 [Patescibacteria group bacterium]